MTTQRDTRTLRPTVALVAAVMAAFVTLLAALAVPTVAEAAENEVPVCHGQGNGGYHLINVAQQAMPAHVEHGDASPGAAVPDQPNLNFDDSCTPVDTTAPVVSVPGDISAEATSSDGAVVSYLASAVDAVDGPIAPVCDVPSESVFPLGETAVSCEATDNAGNTGTAVFTITVVDTTAPVVTVPTSISAEATSSDGAVVSYLASAVDAVDGPIAPVCDVPSESVLPLGETAVSCEATDNAGNTGTAVFTITVVDTTAPVVTVPTTGGGTLSELIFDPSDYDTSAYDTVDGAIVPQCGLESGSVFAVGGANITCTATDNAGNTGTASFTIEITILAYDPSGPISWGIGYSD